MTPNEIRSAIVTMPARVVLSLTVWSEARGEPADGRAAVAWVIQNRSTTRKQTIQAACLQKNQFSCWWGADANSLALYAKAEALLTGEPTHADPAWLETASIAHKVLTGALPDVTKGATFYCTAAFLADPANKDSWFVSAVRSKKLRETVRINRHVFFNE